jgi:hypothetical protein
MPRQGRHATSRKHHPAPFHHRASNAVSFPAAKPAVSPISPDVRLTSLAKLASAEIQTTLVKDLSGSLHKVFDDVCSEALPIYFGPLLGRLYLEGLCPLSMPSNRSTERGFEGRAQGVIDFGLGHDMAEIGKACHAIVG